MHSCVNKLMHEIINGISPEGNYTNFNLGLTIPLMYAIRHLNKTLTLKVMIASSTNNAMCSGTASSSRMKAHGPPPANTELVSSLFSLVRLLLHPPSTWWLFFFITLFHSFFNSLSLFQRQRQDVAHTHVVNNHSCHAFFTYCKCLEVHGETTGIKERSIIHTHRASSSWLHLCGPHEQIGLTVSESDLCVAGQSRNLFYM